MAVHDLIMAAAGIGVKARPTYVATGTRSGSSSGYVDVNKPSGLQVGDLMVGIAMPQSSTVTWTFPSGWTEVYDPGVRPSPAVAWKIADSSDVSASTFRFQSTGGGGSWNGAIAAYRGAAFDVVGTSERITSNTTSITAPAITVSEDNSILIGSFLSDSGGVAVSTAPSGMSLLASNTSRPSSYFYSQNVNAGSSGTKTIVFDSSNHMGALLLSIKPA